MKENENDGRTRSSARQNFIQSREKFPSSVQDLSLYSAQLQEKIQNYPQYPQYMKGKMGKLQKRRSNGVTKQENAEAFSQPSAKLLDFQLFLLCFPYGF